MRVRLSLIVPALLFVAACGDIGVSFGAPVTKSVQVVGNTVTIAGPRGYCIERSASQDSEAGAFVLLGNCASLANSARVTAPAVPGVLTASVSGTTGAKVGTSTGQLERFFTSDAGKLALARNGQVGVVTILSGDARDGAYILKVRDTSPNSVSGLAQVYWRALMDVRGRIVTLSVNGFRDKPMSDAVGRATLSDFMDRVRADNPALVDPVTDPV